MTKTKTNLPEGEYIITIVEGSLTPSSRRDGTSHLWLTLEVAEGDHKGERVKWHAVLLRPPTILDGSDVDARFGIARDIATYPWKVTGTPMTGEVDPTALVGKRVRVYVSPWSEHFPARSVSWLSSEQTNDQ